MLKSLYGLCVLLLLLGLVRGQENDGKLILEFSVPESLVI
jgi:hypothetical protein